MLTTSHRSYFHAAHRLYNSAWTAAKNEAVFGPCANANWHGHNFELVVTVKGQPQNGSGYVIDPSQLHHLVQQEVIDLLDQKNINEDVPFMANKMTSCEVLVTEIWKILSPKISELATNAQLHALRLYETEKNFVECTAH